MIREGLIDKEKLKFAINTSSIKDKNTCNKLEEDACGLASGSKVRETLSSPVSYNLNSTTGNTGGKN